MRYHYGATNFSKNVMSNMGYITSRGSTVICFTHNK